MIFFLFLFLAKDIFSDLYSGENIVILKSVI